MRHFANQRTAITDHRGPAADAFHSRNGEWLGYQPSTTDEKGLGLRSHIHIRIVRA